ncbi:MAG: hypothetical protein ACI33J_05310 [Clostridium sp.]
MTFNICDFMKEKEYQEFCNSLKTNETKVIYSDDNIDIEIKKVGRRIFTLINIYGDKKINEVLNNICSLV